MRILTTLLALLTLVQLAAVNLPAVAMDESDEISTFLAITAPAAAIPSISQSDKVLANAYIKEQLALYGISNKDFVALSPELQREVLSLPGRQTPISREARRTIVPLKVSVPAEVRAKLQKSSVLSSTIVSQYGVNLPASVEMNLSKLPAGYKRMLIGDTIVVMDKGLTITAASSLF